MAKMIGLLVLMGLWTLAATQGDFIDQDIQDIFYPSGDVKTYIVHMMEHAASEAESPRSTYTELLQTIRPVSTLGDDLVPVPVILPVHVYSTACHGFSARLTSKEAEALRQVDGVLGVFPDSVITLHTTRTPDFLALTPSMRSFWHNNPKVQDVIIGMIDTGAWPESESFNDAEMGPVPARWKGICEEGQAFNSSHCNKKLIGARWHLGALVWNKTRYDKVKNPTYYISPRDDNGHGTHTASTAGGALVANANLYGCADGTARGMAPKARIAVYKVCWLGGYCFSSDILKGIDEAVADGVDVISLSLGAEAPPPYAKDSIAIGMFGAMMKGVFVSCSAGNSGPGLRTVSNMAPWMMTVAASTLDRSFAANVELGDGQVLPGQSMYHLKDSGVEATELITGESAVLGNATAAALCLAGSLDPALVKGKIVVCKRGESGRVEKGGVVKEAGGAGMILYNTAADGAGTVADIHLLPATHVGADAGATLLAYMKTTPNPVGAFQFITKMDVTPASAVAEFSSRGPSRHTPEILKPDITAPGVGILAAWSGLPSATTAPGDTRKLPFNIISGTSMSCPHVSGLAALLKAARPGWSPSAIKSAMMTTASQIDNTGKPITDAVTHIEAHPFATGAGYAQPDRALRPGLVYDMGPQDYVNFLCASNISLDVFVGNGTDAPRCPSQQVEIKDMNYPSFTALFKEPPSYAPVSMTMKRTVTNVGGALSIYTSKTVAPEGVSITVTPPALKFTSKYQQKCFTMEITTTNAPEPGVVDATVTKFASLVWSDGVHTVHSAIAISLHK